MENFSGCPKCQYKLILKPQSADDNRKEGYISGDCCHTINHTSDSGIEFYTFEPNCKYDLNPNWFTNKQVKLEEVEIECPDRKRLEKDVWVTLNHDTTDRYILTLRHQKK